jgi:CRISPR-associated protein Cas1
MIKRTLLFGNPAYLSLQHEQLVVRYPDQPDDSKRSVPIEDVGIVVLEDPQITITNKLLERLAQANVAVVHCDSRHMPIGMLMPLVGHTEQQKRFQFQLNASQPLIKNLWQQTVVAKIKNQANLMAKMGFPIQNMMKWAASVKSGDTGNHEARAAAHYWGTIVPVSGFLRDRNGVPPNNLLNYGYAILRAVTARALVGSGLFPILGIHHHNKYNPFCLADDIMEPYRPYVDEVVLELMEEATDISLLTTGIKSELLKIVTRDVWIDGKQSPLMIAMSRTTHSLVQCYEGAFRKILYPDFNGGTGI